MLAIFIHFQFRNKLELINRKDTFQSCRVIFSEVTVVILTQPLFLWPALKESNTVSVCLRVRQM